MRRSYPSEALLAPPASTAVAACRMPGAGTSERVSFPPIDEHVVAPETREELVRGERVQAQPALEQHGDPHFRLDFVLGGHVSHGYVGSTDLLSHFLHGSDFASDTCIRREGTDPRTSRRHLEEVAFEVVHTQTLKKVTERAQDMTRRGVRRVFAVFVKQGTVEEWDRNAGAWKPIPDGIVQDPCLVRPLDVKAVLARAAVGAENQVALALDAKGTPAIAEIEKRGEKRGEERGEKRGKRSALAGAVLAVLEVRGLEVPDRVRAAIEAVEDPETLRAWHARAVTVKSADALLDA